MIQQGHRNNLEIGKFNPNICLNTSQFLIQKSSIGKGIEPNIEEEEIVRKLV